MPRSVENVHAVLWVWSVAIWCSISTLLLGAGGDGQNLLPALVSNVLAAFSMLVPFALWARYRRSVSGERKSSLWSAVFTGAIVGLLKGAVTHGCFAVITEGAISIRSLLESSLAPTIIGMWLVPLFGAVESALNRYSQERELLISERVYDQLTTAQAQLGDEQISAFVTRANARVEKAENSQELISLLQELAEFDVRPMSHSLWQEQERQITNFSLKNLAKQAIIQHRFPALALSAALFVSLYSFQSQFASGCDALMRALFQSSIAFVGFLIGKHLPWRGRWSGPVVFLATPVLISWGLTEVSVLAFGAPPNLPNFLLVSALSLALIASALIFGAVQAARQKHLRIRAELSRHDARGIEDDVETSIALIRKRETAELLHGYVHNQLLRYALRLQESPDEKQLIRSQIDDLLSKLADGQLAASIRTSQSLPELLSEIQKLWEGVIAVNVGVVESGTPAADSEVMLLETVLHELVTNAYRHGNASEVALSVNFSPDFIVVTATDNGLGPSGAKQGLGTKILDAATQNSWNISSTAEGTVVTCRVVRQRKPRTHLTHLYEESDA